MAPFTTILGTAACISLPCILDAANVSVTAYAAALKSAHLLVVATWFGTTVWTSFVAGLVMFKALPRHTFGRLQSKLFPRYFFLSAVCLALAVSTAILAALPHAMTISDVAPKISASLSGGAGDAPVALLAALVCVLINAVVLEPVATSVMFQRQAVENSLNRAVGQELPKTMRPTDPKLVQDPKWKKLSRVFGILHGFSTLINMGALAMGAWYIHDLSAAL